jgi:murein DD-endopeptidase MepM/ murein hydrolase activator NlpD
MMRFFSATQLALRLSLPRLAILLFVLLAISFPGAHARSSKSVKHSSSKTHIVKTGENLYRISLKYSVDMKDICKLNGIADSSQLKVGAKIKIPRRKLQRKGMYHVAKKRVSVSQIAHAYKISPNSLARYNKVSRKEILQPGQMIWIPNATYRCEVGTTTPKKKTRKPERKKVEKKPKRKDIAKSKPSSRNWKRSSRAVRTRARAGGSYHTVKSGDNLRRIGEQYGIANWEWLAHINKMDNPNALEKGQKVWIPDPGNRSSLSAANPSKLKTVSASTSTVFPISSKQTETEYTPTIVPVHIASARGLVWPIDTRGILTTPFGAPRGRTTHRGIDLSAPKGTPIRAVADGVVEVAGSEKDSLGKTMGKHLIISHGRHRNHTLRSIYAHASKILVQQGQKVKKGQIIARVGNTGRVYGSTGNHLHLELWYDDTCIDPWPKVSPNRPRSKTRLVKSR